MRGILRRALNGGPTGSIRCGLRRMFRNHFRILAIALVASLLISALPASSSTMPATALAQQSNSLTAQLYRAVSEAVASVGGLMAVFVTTAPASKSPVYQPVAAHITPAPLFIDAPANLTVTSAASNNISLSWTAPAGTVDHYVLERSENVDGPFLFVANVTGATTKNDNTVTNLHAYLYRVRAVSSGGAVSAPSNMALGTAISFQFSNLQTQEVRAQHFYDVRTAINLVRALGNLSAESWDRGTLAGLEVEANDVNEMRTALNGALQALNIPLTAYDDATLNVGVNGTLTRGIHIEQLQTRSSRGSSTSSGPIDSDSSTARLDPLNETGRDGENLLSRNFNWSLPLVSLPGRANMDLRLTLSYNSLVWTKIGSNAISFNDDNGFPGPGFRIGFPVIQGRYFNNQAGKEAYLMISPDGGRRELRQVGATTSVLFESADSSHLLFNSTTKILQTTDGTQLSYAEHDGELKCTKIKDRNGNFISINYNAAGQISTVTDTLNRVVTFNYTDGWLTSITQVWNQHLQTPTTHYWARFDYTANTPIDYDFGDLTVFGLADNSSIKTLSKVTLADDSHFDFSYTGWGQVYKITSFASDNSPLNYRFYDLPQTAALEHDDCPRFMVRKDWARYWNGDTDGTTNTSEEVATSTFIVPESASWSMPEAPMQSVDGMRAQVTAADGTVNKIYFIGIAGQDTGWRRGLPALVDTFAGGPNPVRRVSTSWTQDDETSVFLLNPRVAETNVRDASGNRARKEVTYEQFDLGNQMSCHLPRDIYEYAADASNRLRTRRTLYNMSTTYKNLRILGLISGIELYQGDANAPGAPLKSKAAFFYDETDSVQGEDVAVHHENPAFVIGRGNLSSAKRYNANDTLEFTTTVTRYNRSGGVVSTKDGLSHEITFSYADSFSDNNNTRNTFAYPTTVLDADNFASTAKYNFDFGGVTYRRTPEPNTTNTSNTNGPVQSFDFDSIGRLLKVTHLFNGAYTRWDYSAAPTRIDTFTTIQSGQGEARSFQIHDGSGRVVAAATTHPGSSGGYSGEKMVYDNMGRMIKTSNPTETHATGFPNEWDTAGDDASWLFTEQTYDWRGRPLITTNPSMGSNPALTTTRQVSYTGCGCVGGEAVTFTDEVGRRQKLYTDILGRSIKMEVLNWDGSVYSTSVVTYDVRDLATQLVEYAGVEGSQTSQTTTRSYDGYGRLQSEHTPEHASGTATTWAYNADDTVSSITDARGASQTVLYNNRHLPTSITYAAPVGISIPAPVTLTYDGAGNRTTMLDGFGTQSYEYDQVSRLTEETREFPVGTFSINYSYNLVGQLTGLTDPFGASISYTRDVTGQLTGISGSPFNGVTNYISNIQYRAWGDPKSVTYDAANSTISYNGRMLPKEFRLTRTSNGNSIIREDYGYYGDGNLATVTDLDDTGGNNPPSTLRFLSRAFEYDHVGRVTLGKGNGGGGIAVPYSQAYGYDAFGNLTGRSGSYYNYMNAQPSFSDTATYVNNRRTGWTYNANGQLLSTPASSTDQARSMTYDAAGNLTNMVETRTSSTVTYSAAYDGDDEIVFETNTTSPGTSESAYAVRSTVLDGEVLTRVDQSGNKKVTHVPTFGLLIARQVIHQGSPVVGISYRNPHGNREAGLNVSDPLGNFIPFQGFGDPRPPAGSYSSASLSGLAASLANPHAYGNGCLLDGSPVNCSLAMRLVNNGSAQRCPQNDCGPRFVEGRLRPLFLTEEGFGVWVETQRKPPTLKRSTKPPKKVTPKQRRENERRRQREAKQGNSEDQKPKAAEEILVPLDVNRLEDLMRRTLSFSDCADYVRRLITKVADQTNRPFEDTDVMSLFERIKGQEKGGVLFDQNDVPGHPEVGNVSGGGGWAWGWYSQGNAMINIYRRSYFTDNVSDNPERIPYHYGEVGVHEVIHLSAKGGLGYTEAELTTAARALDPNLDYRDWDGYLKHHCVPAQYR